MRLDWAPGLAALLLVPLALALYLAAARRRAPRAIRYTNIEVLATVSVGVPRRRTYLPAACMLLASTCALAALARPEARVAGAREPASIVLAVDMSGSMAATDVRPSRLSAAETAIRHFVSGLPRQDRVGLVTFSSSAVVAAPLTRDRDAVLGALRFAAAPGQGTAIGDAIARSVELLEPPVARELAVRPARADRRAADGDPPALGRRADAREPDAARGRGAREGPTDPGLLDRARNAAGRDQRRRHLAARAARPAYVATDRARHRRDVLGPRQRDAPR